MGIDLKEMFGLMGDRESNIVINYIRGINNKGDVYPFYSKCICLECRTLNLGKTDSIYSFPTKTRPSILESTEEWE
ncbi:unnamed protein product [Citrullus colocynthis]|uniref:Uncharacterized protein n=1 Tax=Citrullus colocynthis TaxID=252529 RepID=A0ABP0YNR7_9ROSI